MSDEAAVIGDFDELPWPVMAISTGGELHMSPSFKELVAVADGTAESLAERFEISRLGGGPLARDDLPWRRGERGETFTDDEVWYDRQTARRHFFHVRSRARAGRALIAFEDVGDQPFSMRFADLVSDLGSALLRTEDPSGLAHALLDDLARDLGADAVFLMAAERGEHLRLLAFLGVPREFVEEREAGLTDTVMAMAARTGEIQEVDRIQDLPEPAYRGTRRLLELGLNAVVALPLLAAGEVVGVLEIARKRPGKLNAIERRLLRGVAAACALSLRQARIRASERRETERLRTLRETANAIQAALPLRELLRRLVEQACELTRARYGALGVLSPDGRGLSDFVYVGASEEVARQIGHLPEGRGLLGAVIREARPIRIADIRKDPRSVRFPPNHPTMTSFLGVPLLIGRQVFGNLYLCDKDGGVEFTDEDERLVQLFAAQSSLAVAYARQLKITEEANGEIDRLRNEFAAVIAHDLRSPVAAILMQVEALLAGAESDRASVPVVALQRLRRLAHRVSEMAGDLLDASRIEIGRLTLDRKELSLEEAVHGLLGQIQSTLGGHPVSVDVEGHPPLVSADPYRLDQILTNLLDNAAKYSSPGAPIRVIVRAETGGVTVTVADRGVGIAAEDLPRLFDRFYQARRAREKKTGLGLGLYIAKGLVEAHGGTISVESTPGQGSSFRLWFPAAAPARP